MTFLEKLLDFFMPYFTVKVIYKFKNRSIEIEYRRYFLTEKSLIKKLEKIQNLKELTE